LAGPFETPEQASTDGGSGQPIDMFIVIASDLPEACLDTKVVVNVVTEVVKLRDEVLIGNRFTVSVDSAVSAPFDDPFGHTFDDIRGVGLDDDEVDVTKVREFAVPEHVSEVAESVNGGGELGALTGWVDSVTELE
jgi:hypothetical protein